MGRRQPVENEKITQSMKAVIVHLTENETSVDHTKTVIESATGTETETETETERRIRKGHTIGREEGESMKRNDTARDMEERIMIATDVNFARGREIVTIIVTAAVGTESLAEIGECNPSKLIS